MSWDEDDRAKALAYEEWRARACPKCRTRPEDWAEDRFAYIVHEYPCPGCELLDQHGEQLERSGGKRDRKGIHTGLVPRRLAKRVEREMRAERKRSET